MHIDLIYKMHSDVYSYVLAYIIEVLILVPHLSSQTAKARLQAEPKSSTPIFKTKTYYSPSSPSSYPQSQSNPPILPCHHRHGRP